MAEVARSDTSSPETDKDFDPSAEMLVNEYDDERTLDEEEAMASGDSCTGELDDLQKESEIPIEALLAQYSAAAAAESSNVETMEQAENSRSTASSSEEEILESQNLTLDKEVVARDLLNNGASAEDRDISVNELIQNVSRSHTERLLRSTSQAESDESSSEEEDENYEPVEEPKKTIQVGSDYQAVIPAGLHLYGDAPAYENEDRLLWDPSKIKDESALDGYLRNVQWEVDRKLHAVANIPRGKHIRDDEQALFLLLQCDNNIEEAERRRKMQAVPPTDVMSLWSEDECRNFEDGLRLYGKNFHEIHHNKVRTRSVFELVHFYYLWKKTERHDVFAAKTRAEKRKYSLNPGVLDHMDRFLEEQEVELHQLIAPQTSIEHSFDGQHVKSVMDMFSTGRTTIVSAPQPERNPVSKVEQSLPQKRSFPHNEVNGNNNEPEVSASCPSPPKFKTDGTLIQEEPSPKRQKLDSENDRLNTSPSKTDNAAAGKSSPATVPQTLPSSNNSVCAASAPELSSSDMKQMTNNESSLQLARAMSGSQSAVANTSDSKTMVETSADFPTLSGKAAGNPVGNSVALSLAADISNSVLQTISADPTAV